MERRKTVIGTICTLACQFIFGFSLLFTRTATDLVSPMTLLSWRFIVAFVFFTLCVFLGVIKVKIAKPFLSLVLIVAVFYPFLYFVGETIGVGFTSASESGAMLAVIPIVTLICSIFLLKVMPTKSQILGICVSVMGIVVIVLVQGIDAVFSLPGYAMLLLAVISYALYAVFAQKAATFTSAEKSYVMTVLGAVVFTVIALVENGMKGTWAAFFMLPLENTGFLVAILYLGIGSSVGAFLLYNTAIANIGATRAVSFSGVSTIVSIMAGVVILRESFSLIQGIGAVLVVGGVYLANKMN